jgi:hypothetical protein
MTRHYDSFVLRCWQLSDEQRIEVEHLQSGGRTRAETLGGAFTWIDIHCGQPVERDAVVSPADGRTEEVMCYEVCPADNGENG